jgi:O-antigen ligase
VALDIKFRPARPTAIRLLLLGFVTYPLAWILGLGAVYPLVIGTIAGLFLFMKRRWDVRINGPIFLLFLFTIAYTVSLIIAVLQNPQPRLLSGAYNLGIWYVGLLILLVVLNAPQSSQTLERRIAKLFVGLGALIGGVSAVLLVSWVLGERYVQFPSLLEMLLPAASIDAMPTLLREHIRLTPLGTDWMFNGLPIPRLSLLHPYPNALALSSGLSLIAFFYLRRLRHERSLALNAGSLVLLLLLSIPLLFSLSRITLLGFALISSVIAFRNLRLAILARVALTLGLTVLALVTVVLAPQSVLRTADRVAEAREGSTLTRLGLYRTTISTSMNNGALGLGYKPDKDSAGRPLSVPLGSHSTLLGALLKTGILGFTLILLFFLSIGYRSLANIVAIRDPTIWLHASILLVLLWATVEDLDAPPFLAYQVFIMLGLTMRVSRRSVRLRDKGR